MGRGNAGRAGGRDCDETRSESGFYEVTSRPTGTTL